MLEDLDLAAAMQWQVEEYARRSELQCEAGTMEALVLPDTRTSLALFRILQEALQNAARREGVTRVIVDLVSEGNNAVLRVTDNGHGIINEDVMKPGEPTLVSIRARAHSFGGTARLGRTAEGGSVLEVTAPLREEGAEQATEPNHT